MFTPCSTRKSAHRYRKMLIFYGKTPHIEYTCRLSTPIARVFAPHCPAIYSGSPTNNVPIFLMNNHQTLYREFDIVTLTPPSVPELNAFVKQFKCLPVSRVKNKNTYYLTKPLFIYTISVVKIRRRFWKHNDSFIKRYRRSVVIQQNHKKIRQQTFGGVCLNV